mmetsp:Transcript_33323/g.82562  ORF Transcript_33323/g.82562 Transcript_33323/m.82562 type:complete len:286 (+) Transcript_33323:1046-1903(+)
MIQWLAPASSVSTHELRRLEETPLPTGLLCHSTSSHGEDRLTARPRKSPVTCDCLLESEVLKVRPQQRRVETVGHCDVGGEHALDGLVPTGVYQRIRGGWEPDGISGALVRSSSVGHALEVRWWVRPWVDQVAVGVLLALASQHRTVHRRVICLVLEYLSVEWGSGGVLGQRYVDRLCVVCLYAAVPGHRTVHRRTSLSSPECCFKWGPLELTPKIRHSHIAPRSNGVQVDGVDGVHCGAGHGLTILCLCEVAYDGASHVDGEVLPHQPLRIVQKMAFVPLSLVE